MVPYCQACTTRSLVCRSFASSSANRSACLACSDWSTPTTIRFMVRSSPFWFCVDVQERVLWLRIGARLRESDRLGNDLVRVVVHALPLLVARLEPLAQVVDGVARFP